MKHVPGGIGWLVCAGGLASLLGCAEAPRDEGPADEPPAPAPEIDGLYVNPEHGWCLGAVGGDPRWARCSGGACDALPSEQRCLGAVQCRAVYFDDVRTDAVERLYRNCVPVAAGVAEGACAALGAYACAQRDDCSAVHSGNFPAFSPFLRCDLERAP